MSAIRGVNVDGVMRTLVTRGLVEEAGTDTESQAAARAGDGRDNKGFEAAAAGIEMAQLFRQLRTGTHPTRDSIK